MDRPPDPASAGLTNLEKRLRGFVCETFERSRLDPDENFFACGGTTRRAALLRARIEGEIDGAAVRLRADEGGFARVLYEEPTVRALAAFLEGDRTANPLLTRLRAGAPDVAPVFWNHGMFNGDGVYAWELAAEVAAEVPFYVLHPHGADDAPFPGTIGELAEDHLRLIRTVRPHGPYRLGGYCNGALVMYEIAVRLRAAGEIVRPPVFVGLPPLRPLAERLAPLGDALSHVLAFDEYGQMKLRRVIRLFVERLHRGGRSAIAPEASGDPFGDRYFKLKRYMDAIASYAVPSFDGRPILAYGRDVYPEPESEAGWAAHVAGLDVRVIPGGHFAASESPREVGRIVAEGDAAG